jgi:uncharacterized MnhB-related membrane protein
MFLITSNIITIMLRSAAIQVILNDDDVNSIVQTTVTLLCYHWVIIRTFT